MSLRQSREATGTFSFIERETPNHKPSRVAVEFIPPLESDEQDALTHRGGSYGRERIVRFIARVGDRNLIPEFFNSRDNLSDTPDRAEWEVRPLRVPAQDFELHPTGNEANSIVFGANSEMAIDATRDAVAKHIAAALPHRSEV